MVMSQSVHFHRSPRCHPVLRRYLRERHPPMGYKPDFPQDSGELGVFFVALLFSPGPQGRMLSQWDNWDSCSQHTKYHYFKIRMFIRDTGSGSAAMWRVFFFPPRRSQNMAVEANDRPR